MNNENHFDYFVIGAGSGGVRSARIAASLGAKVGVAEGKVVGGTCVNVGCVPKKLMAYAADYHTEFMDASGYGWDVQEKGFDFPKMIARKNAEIERLNGIYNGLLDKNNVSYFDGFGSFVDANTVQIGDQTVTADKILIATGAKPRISGIEGEAYTKTSDEIFYLDALPEHILIVGGGYIAVEFAHIFSGMGSKVTLCYRGDLFLRGFDEDIRLFLKEEMEKQGIDLLFETDLLKVEKQQDSGVLKAHLTGGHALECDEILSAIGRVPNTDGLGLDNLGVKTDKSGRILVDDFYQTSVDNIYALGDVTNKYQLTPVATKEGQTLARRLFADNDPPSVCYDNIATAVFSRPAIATVGYGEEAARQAGLDVSAHITQFRPMKYILAERDEKIFMKLVVCNKTDKVLGVHMVGLDAPEIMQGFAVALNAGATKADFDKTIGIHPTAAEEFVTMS